MKAMSFVPTAAQQFKCSGQLRAIGTEFNAVGRR